MPPTPGCGSGWPETLKRIVNEGHQLANHTYNHKNLNTCSAQTVAYEISAVQALITAAGGDENAYIRAPYGNANKTVKSVVTAPLIYWSVDPEDWKYRNAETVRSNIESGVFDGAIILVHDIYKTSVDGALAAIDDLMAEGYEFVTVKDLLLAESDDTEIKEIMTENVISVTTQDDQEEVAKMFSKYNFLALPVVDTEKRMVGIVTFDDAMDVMEEEATEDMEIMAAMTPSEKSYLKSTPFDLYKHRIPWLMLLMVSATFTGMIISSFESALALLPALTAFIPMLMDTGGNCGSQSSVTVIRALSLDELELSDVFAVLWKEVRTAVLCGISLAAVCFLKVLLVDRLLMHNESISLSVDLVICLALGVTVVMAKMVGCTLPLLAKRLGFDPAVMASPFITTIVDALSLLVYFLFAKTILGL